MFIDTSAIVAILADEPEAASFLTCIEAARNRQTGAHVRLEAPIALARLLGLPIPVAVDLYDAFLATAGITVISISDGIARRAVQAFEIYGRGRGHAAQLDFPDCLSYACAAAYRAPILFKGRDFARTDLKPAL